MNEFSVKNKIEYCRKLELKQIDMNTKWTMFVI